MRKFLTLMLAFIMVLGAVGCGNKKDTTTTVVPTAKGEVVIGGLKGKTLEQAKEMGYRFVGCKDGNKVELVCYNPNETANNILNEIKDKTIAQVRNMYNISMHHECVSEDAFFELRVGTLYYACKMDNGAKAVN